VIEAGWGLYMTPFVGIPFTAIAFRRRVPVVATAQLYVAAGALIVLRHRSLPGAGRLWCGLLAPVTFAALWPTGRLLMGICAGPSALYLGLVYWVSHPTGKLQPNLVGTVHLLGCRRDRAEHSHWSRESATSAMKCAVASDRVG
jgi:hypothetical protein